MTRHYKRSLRLTFGWAAVALAALPVLCAGFAMASAGDARDLYLFHLARRQEMSIASAMASRNTHGLDMAGSYLASQVDMALLLKRTGRRATSCDLTVLSLAGLAVFGARAFRGEGDFRDSLADGGSRKIARDYAREMRACAALVGRPAGRRPDFSRLFKTR